MHTELVTDLKSCVGQHFEDIFNILSIFVSYYLSSVKSDMSEFCHGNFATGLA